MSEKDGKRVLSPAEKAEADALTTSNGSIPSAARREAADDCPIPMTVGIVLLPISG